MYKGLKMTRVQCIPLNYPLVIQIVAEKVMSKIFCRLFQFQQMQFCLLIIHNGRCSHRQT